MLAQYFQPFPILLFFYFAFVRVTIGSHNLLSQLVLMNVVSSFFLYIFCDINWKLARTNFT